MFAALVAVLLGPSLAGARVPLPLDLLLERQPWAAGPGDVRPGEVPLDDVRSTEVRPANVELRDQIDTYYPVQHELADRLRAGEGADWLHDVGLGMPGARFVGWGLWSPFNLPAAALDFPLAWAWGMALRLFAAMAGAYLLTRRLGAGRLGGTVAGMAYGLSGFMVLWLGWPQSHVGAVIPWLLSATERTVARDARWWHGVALALSTAALWLGGFPAVAAYALIAAGCVALHTAWGRRDEPRRDVAAALAAAAGGVLLGTGLVTFTLLPSVRILEEFNLGYRDFAWQTTLPLHALLTFAAPGFFGDVAHHQLWLGVSYVESVGYAGVVTLSLAAAAWALGPRRPGLGLYTGLGAGFLLFVYGFPPLRALLSAVPLLRGNVPTRALALVCLAVAVVGGLGADALERLLRGEAAWRRHALQGLAIGATVAAGVFVALRPPPALRRLAYERLTQEAAQLAGDVAARELLAAVGFAAAAAAVCASALRVARRNHTGRDATAGHDATAGRDGIGGRAGPAATARLLTVGLVGLLAWDLVAFAGGWNGQQPAAGLFPPAPGLSRLAELSAEHRVAGGEGVLLPNTHLEYGVADARAHGFVTWRFGEVLDRLGARRPSPTQWDLAAADSGRWLPWLPLLGVAEVLLPATVDRLGGLLVQPRDQAVDGPLTGGRRFTLEQTAPRTGAVHSVLVRVGTYGRRNDGELVARIRAAAGQREGRVLAADLADLSWVDVPITPLPTAIGEPLTVELTTTASDPDAAITLFGGSPVAGGPFVPAVALGYDTPLTLEPVTDAPGLRRVVIPDALPLVRAVPTAVAVLPASDAPQEMERLGPEALRTAAVVEPYGDKPLPPLPSGGSATLHSWRRAGGRVLARVGSDAGAVLVTRDQALEGWRAKVDGGEAPVVRADHLFAGVVVPPGEHTVELVYTPPLAALGMASSVRSLAALAGWALLRWLRERTGMSTKALLLTAARVLQRSWIHRATRGRES